MIVHLYKSAQRCIADSPIDARITWAFIQKSLGPLIFKVTRLNRLDPKMPEEEMAVHFDTIIAEIDGAFVSIAEG